MALGNDLIQKQLTDKNSYAIGDLSSDSETDDDASPRNAIPKWAQGSSFKTALIVQAYKRPSHPDSVFSSPEISQDFSSYL